MVSVFEKICPQRADHTKGTYSEIDQRKARGGANLVVRNMRVIKKGIGRFYKVINQHNPSQSSINYRTDVQNPANQGDLQGTNSIINS